MSEQIVSTNKTRQIGFITIIAIVVGSCIGAGIFFKNATVWSNSHYNLVYAIMSWVIAGIGIIALAFCLLELSSSTKGDKGIVGWTEDFTKKWFFKSSKTYFLFIYYPMNFVAMPVYAVQSISDATGYNFLWWQILLLALALYLWLSLMSIYSLRLSTGAQWIMTVIKFIPIFMVPILSYLNVFNGTENTDWWNPANVAESDRVKPYGFAGISPIFGLMASIPAIFFAFDGFYTATSIAKSCKEPKKMGLGLLFGMVVVLSVYLLLSSGLFLATNPVDADNAGLWSGVQRMPQWVITTINWTIFVAVLGIANGFAIGTYRVYDEYILDENEKMMKPFKNLGLSKRKFSNKYMEKIFSPWTSGFITINLLTFAFYLLVLVFGLIIGSSLKADGNSYGTGLAQGIYNFTDYLTNWTSLLVFVYIAGAVFGGVINKKTKNVNTRPLKNYTVLAYVGVFIVLIPSIYFYFSPIVNLIWFNDPDENLNSILTIVLMNLTIIVTLLPGIMDFINTKKQHKVQLNKK